jgi:hypothetical protein
MPASLNIRNRVSQTAVTGTIIVKKERTVSRRRQT